MKQLLVLLCLLCSASVFAQDVIVKNDGTTIVCRVVELTSSEITYKKWSDLNGSNYVMNRADASAINYENGKKVNLSDVTNLYMPNNQNDGTQQYNDRTLLTIDEAAHVTPEIVKKYRKIAWIGGGAFLAAGLFFFSNGIFGGFINYDYPSVNAVGFACLGASAAWTTTFLLIANHQKKKIENQIYEFSFYEYDIPLNNGSTLSLGADLLRDKMLGQSTLGLGLRYNF